ncbi:MAG: hypothetical protein GXO31_07765 [Epsilonproteobacteria bacterium]|nr:hypothetical protein [Campylobacterota bacterium]
MTKKLLDFLLKRDILNILYIQESFFRKVDFQEPVKMNEEAVRLNYSNLSPFPKSSIIYKNEGKTLYIWFYKDENLSKSKIVIPEAYLIYKAFKGEDVIVIIYFSSNSLFIL